MRNKVLKIIGLSAFAIGLLVNISLNNKKAINNVVFDKIALISQANASSEDCNTTNYPYLALRYCGSSMTWACIKTHTAEYCDVSMAVCCKDS